MAGRGPRPAHTAWLPPCLQQTLTRPILGRQGQAMLTIHALPLGVPIQVRGGRGQRKRVLQQPKVEKQPRADGREGPGTLGALGKGTFLNSCPKELPICRNSSAATSGDGGRDKKALNCRVLLASGVIPQQTSESPVKGQSWRSSDRGLSGLCFHGQKKGLRMKIHNPTTLA